MSKQKKLTAYKPNKKTTKKPACKTQVKVKAHTVKAHTRKGPAKKKK